MNTIDGNACPVEGEEDIMDDSQVQAIAAAVAAAVASQSGAGAGTMNARTASNDERADHMDVAHERGRTTDWVSGGVEHGSDVNYNETIQRDMVEAHGRNRNWHDVGMERLSRHIENVEKERSDLHLQKMNMEKIFQTDLAQEYQHHRTMRGKNYTNLYSQVDEMEIVANKLAEALVPMIVEAAKKA